ncbi:MAG: PAS domain-containing sensor histidine kinase [Undibacterium sp.]|nr:PAS domain-containing sensor histidine kinase [Undibacterium sp.]
MLVQRRTLELEESKWRLQSVLDHAADGILTVTADGRIASANRAAEVLLSHQAGELETKALDQILVDREDVPFRIQSLSENTLGEALTINELRHLRADGSELSVELAIGQVRHHFQDMNFAPEMPVVDQANETYKANSPVNLQSAYIIVLHDLTERKRADKVKSEFVSSVSHELRTPLTAIRGTLGLIVGGALGEVPQKMMPLLSMANSNAERLHTLINDILDFEKLEYGGMLFKFETHVLLDLLIQTVEYNTAYAEKFSVHLVVQVEEQYAALSANVDKGRLIQVLSNLISNAIKFSPRGSQVTVTMTRHDETVRITVQDHGIGISEEFRSRIFRKFSQEDASINRKYAGTGLGLSLAKSMMEKMQGSIGFESVLGQGSSFYIELPLFDRLID